MNYEVLGRTDVYYGTHFINTAPGFTVPGQTY